MYKYYLDCVPTIAAIIGNTVGIGVFVVLPVVTVCYIYNLVF